MFYQTVKHPGQNILLCTSSVKEVHSKIIDYKPLPRDNLRSWLYCVGAIKVLAAEPRLKKGSGDKAFEILAARAGPAAKSHLTSTQYRQLFRLSREGGERALPYLA